MDRKLIGFDAKRVFSNSTGLGSYGRTLINTLAALPLELRLYAPDHGICFLRRQIKRSDNIRTAYPRHLPFGKLSKALWRTFFLVHRLKQDGIQLYHGLSGELPVGIRKSGIKSVVTIHDLIFLRHPEYYNWFDVNIYTWKFRRTIREADHIIAISECTKRDIIDLGGVDEDRISVIYQGCAPRFTPEGSDPAFFHLVVPDRYLLYVGTIERRKNVLLAVKALLHLPEEVSLVIVGRQTAYYEEVFDFIWEHRLEERVRFFHNITDEQLPEFYSRAEAFVYPSRYEGFGIPIIEAINSGLPVVACTGSCLEEAGGPDSLYVDPDDIEGFAEAIKQVLQGAEGREERIRRSQQYVRRFEGADVARQVYDLYNKLLEP